MNLQFLELNHLNLIQLFDFVKSLIEKKNTQKTFENINKEITINLLNVETKLKHKIKNFNLIGKINKGKFVKLSSKGEFSNNRKLMR